MHTLYKTATGQRLHLRQCPHVLGCELIEVVEGSHDICSWCLAEISGVGRTPHTSIEDALRDMGAPEVVVPVLARHLRTVEHDDIWVPFSRSYVALGKAGRGVAWAGITYVAFRDRPPVLLPEYVAAGRSAGTPLRDAWGDVCPRHFLARSLSGECEGCL